MKYPFLHVQKPLKQITQKHTLWFNLKYIVFGIIKIDFDLFLSLKQKSTGLQNKKAVGANAGTEKCLQKSHKQNIFISNNSKEQKLKGKREIFFLAHTRRGLTSQAH